LSESAPDKLLPVGLELLDDVGVKVTEVVQEWRGGPFLFICRALQLS
jgi:hypothetical protein